MSVEINSQKFTNRRFSEKTKDILFLNPIFTINVR